MTFIGPVASVIPRPPSPVNHLGSVSMWANVSTALRQQRRSPVVEVMLPRTLPVETMDDVVPYHFVEADGKVTLRKGAPPQAVKGAAADFANGDLDLNGFLDRIGVPK